MFLEWILSWFDAEIKPELDIAPDYGGSTGSCGFCPPLMPSH